MLASIARFDSHMHGTSDEHRSACTSACAARCQRSSCHPPHSRRCLSTHLTNRRSNVPLGNFGASAAWNPANSGARTCTRTIQTCLLCVSMRAGLRRRTFPACLSGSVVAAVLVLPRHGRPSLTAKSSSWVGRRHRRKHMHPCESCRHPPVISL